MSLNKIVAEAADAHENAGIIDRHAAINDAVPKVLAEPELTEMCVRGHLSKMIASNAKSRSREREKANPGQASFFGLRDAHVVDDGEGNIKRTVALTRIEFEQLIIVRQDQVNADLAYLSRLRQAHRDTKDIWDKHPSWTWGEVEREYACRQTRAA